MKILPRQNQKFLVALLALLSCGRTFALDFANSSLSLGDKFESFIDDYEGETGFRSLLIPSGGRAESLGTAFTALADDINFFDYNPAASSVLAETEIAFFHNSWIADSNVESFAATTRDANTGYGALLKCFYVPFSEYNFFGDRTASSYYSETSVAFNISHNFFHGYNFMGLALGANVKAAYRSVPDYADNDTNSVISGSGLSQSGLALMADLGLLVRANIAKAYYSRQPNFGFGLSISNIGAGITGFGRSVGLDDPLPTRVSGGIFYRPINPLTITAEVRRMVNLQAFSHASTVSVAAGGEIRLTDFFSVMGGFLVQGGNPRISFGSEFEVRKIVASLNYTFDLTSSMNPVNHISLSAKMRLGDKGRSATAKEVERLYLEGVVRYAKDDLDGAEALWSRSAEIARDKLGQKYDPALEALSSVQSRKTIIDTLNERERLRSLQAGTEEKK